MGHDDEPLRPVYNPQLPPWIGRYTGREYKGRLDWWNELGFHVEDEINRKWVPVHEPIREHHRDWYDPKVKDGTSLANLHGLDTKFYPDMAKKGDTPINQFKFQEQVMKSSAQYKQIAEKYNLSPEHPGIAVSPGLSALSYTPKNFLGFEGVVMWPKSWLTWGPRFFDKPMNEGCFEKGAALVKYTALGTLFYAGMKWRKVEDKSLEYIRFKEIGKLYLKSLPVPCALAFAYGSAICTSAVLRNTDDVWNHVNAAVFTSICLSTIKGAWGPGIILSLPLLTFGQAWHYNRVTRYGIAGPARNPSYGGIWGTGAKQHEAHNIGGHIGISHTPY
ncbi:unnamed protein product [Bursaphelenchus xylophilus]|uniref:(pine wood nematode) hypothetical protein n=1 Tax=Bursaphelenchus xylophilus TaxID=6326 RepID=A0A1I7RPP9_BURXY|nr:unnamed protein product [Bursaphelenchus xylophilus]CAG9096415.1 unnamed protein product [Bursaphelenchus xylophilus]